jgi:restriction system protein
LVYIDQYGVEKAEKWEKEKLYITSTVINSKLHADGFDSMPTKLLLQLIEHAARSVKLDNEVADIADVTTGIQYEKYCAEALLKAGWNARLTAATGDQGTDIVAERDGRRVIVQCKFYSSPVGNKAVQEAAAARLHERADQAIVVSNAEYTKSARQLAGTTGVILLHHDNLKNL